MALQECTLNLDRTLRELRPHGSIEFPCAGYASVYSEERGREIPWHYHNEFEIILAVEGSILVQIPGKTFRLKEGDSVFINAGILHRAEAVPYCAIRSIVFSQSLITGNGTSILAQKYVEPMIGLRELAGIFLSNEVQWQQKLISCFQSAFEAILESAWGYEFQVRDYLSKFFGILSERYEEQMKLTTKEGNSDQLRIRKMMDYIHEHYAEELALTQIAQAADIGERECLRCFNRMIQMSPIQYLIKYRIMLGAAMLLEGSERSIAEIAAGCGFDSPSNFSKLFKRFFECTPREYRKNYT